MNEKIKVSWTNRMLEKIWMWKICYYAFCGIIVIAVASISFSFEGCVPTIPLFGCFIIAVCVFEISKLNRFSRKLKARLL